MLGRISYNSTHDKKEFVSSDCEQLTEYEFDDFVGLTGIFGFPDDLIDEDLKVEITKFGKYPKLGIRLECKLFEIERIINVKTKVIKNNLFVLNGIGNRSVGRKVFSSQIEEAEKAGIKRFTVEAAQGIYIDKYGEPQKYNGYVTWAKFGYLMQPKYQKKFDLKILKWHRTEATVNELVLSKEKSSHNGEELNGLEVWDKFGEKWFGTFWVNRPSKSRDIFDAYLNSNRKT